MNIPMTVNLETKHFEARHFEARHFVCALSRSNQLFKTIMALLVPSVYERRFNGSQFESQ